MLFNQSCLRDIRPLLHRQIAICHKNIICLYPISTTQFISCSIISTSVYLQSWHRSVEPWLKTAKVPITGFNNYYMHMIVHAVLATIFHVVDIFSDSGYSIYFLLFFPFNINHVLCINFVMVNFIVCDTCLLCIWCGTLGRRRGCVYNVGRSLFVCNCIVGTPMRVLHAACLNDNW